MRIFLILFFNLYCLSVYGLALDDTLIPFRINIHKVAPKIRSKKDIKPPPPSSFSLEKMFFDSFEPEIFPPWLIDEDDLVGHFFEPFGLYARHLSRTAVVRTFRSQPSSDQGLRRTFSVGTSVFMMEFYRSQSSGEMIEGIRMYSDSKRAGELQIRRLGQDVLPTDPERFFSFDPPLPAANTLYEIKFSGFQTKVTIETTVNELTSSQIKSKRVLETFHILGGTVLLSEDFSQNFVSRKYKTDFSGEHSPNFRVTAETANSKDWRIRYSLDDYKATSPNQFLTQFSPWVSNLLGGDLPLAMLTTIAPTLGWPLTDPISLTAAGLSFE
jgi:hypothetical protein